MSSLPNQPKNFNPKNPKVPLVRDNTGKFVKSTISVPSFGKENQPNFEEVYLEEVEKTKELKEQLAELEKETEVKEIKGEIELPEMVKNQGVEMAGPETPVSSEPSVVLSLDDTKIFNLVKKIKYLRQNVRDSIYWLALWSWRQLLLAHVKLKEVHGKIVRQNA